MNKIRHNYSVAVLMTCHNRVETTLACLRRLVPQLGNGDKVFLVDDGSEDNTGAKVKTEFPEVDVINGDGTLYWAKGMRLAWETAIKSGRKFDFFLWLNDDVMLKPDAISVLISDFDQLIANRSFTPVRSGSLTIPVVVGACAMDESFAASSYAATNRKDERIEPNGVSPQKAEGWFNGNVVFIPFAAYAIVGMISDDYSHSRADYDYAERLKRKKIPFYASSNFVGVCRRDSRRVLTEKGLAKRIRYLFMPGNTNLHDLWRYRRRHFGYVRAFVSCCHLMVHVLFANQK